MAVRNMYSMDTVGKYTTRGDISKCWLLTTLLLLILNLFSMAPYIHYNIFFTLVSAMLSVEISWILKALAYFNIFNIPFTQSSKTNKGYEYDSGWGDWVVLGERPQSVMVLDHVRRVTFMLSWCHSILNISSMRCPLCATHAVWHYTCSLVQASIWWRHVNYHGHMTYHIYIYIISLCSFNLRSRI